MFFKRSIIFISILSLLSSPLHSLEIQESKEILSIINTQGRSFSHFFSDKSKRDSVFGPLLASCEAVGMDKCYDTIIKWLKKTNVVEINLVKLSVEMSEFLSSFGNQCLNNCDINSLKNISYLDSIYKAIKKDECNKKACRKIKNNDVVCLEDELNIKEQIYRQKSRDEKYSSKYV